VQNDFNILAPYLSGSPVPEMLYESITKWRPDEKGVWGSQPGLALSWEQQGNVATFKLRQGVKFHDGTEWNAKVAKWNLDRMLTHTKSQAKTYMGFIDPAKGVEVVDDYTIKINMKAPSAAMPALLSGVEGQVYMVSQAAVEKLGDDEFSRRPVGSGPFEFVEWKSGDRTTLKRFENYWQMGADGKPLPYLDGFVYRFIPDDSVRFLELRSGNIDFTEILHSKDLPTAKADPRLVVVDGPWIGNMYRLAMNATFGPFSQNQKLRHAAHYAIDKDAIAKTLGLGTGMALRYELVPGMQSYDESVPYHSYDQTKAKQLMQEAGLAGGTDVTLILSARMLDQQQAEMIKSMWDAVGIRTTIDAMERVAWAQKVRDAKAEFHVTSLRGTNKPDHGKARVIRFGTGGPNNDARYSNKEMDKCLDEADRNLEPKQRAAVHKRCQQIAFEDGYYGFVWTQVWNWAHTKDLKDFQSTWNMQWQLAGAWLDR
jgi:peptide/nickel transport system substrate-binding protein